MSRTPYPIILGGGLLWAAMTGAELISRLIEIRDTIREDEETGGE